MSRDAQTGPDVEERRVHALVRERLLGTSVPPLKIGRYTVIELVGSGGLGVVYAAYDPDLDRKIAVKLVRPDHDEGEGSAASQARLLREAQAMARLSHHNVIHVYDVGTFEDQVFVAMEFVAGCSLRTWLEREPRLWRETLAVFIAAGRGLVAAHDGGMIHRDFKPDNVLVDESGRAYVVDFGLARATHVVEEAQSSTAEGRLDPSDSALQNIATPLTQTGALLGTPAYMAPEQFKREATDARTDQYGFCVSLWEGLYGARPFDGSTMAELAARVCEGKAPRPGTQTKVPHRLRQVLLRGLSVDPGDRFPSMDELLAELAYDPARTRARYLAGATVIGAMALGGWGLWRGADRESGLCRGAGEALVGVWDSSNREAIATAFRATRMPYADVAYERVQHAFDSYADEWTAMRTEACEASRVRGEQSDRLLDRRIYCLDRRLSALEATVQTLAKADGETIAHAASAARSLPSIGRCGDTKALLARVAPPDDARQRAAVDGLRSELDRIKAQLRAGHYEPAREQADRAVEDAQATGYRPLEAEALNVRSRAEHLTGKNELAAASLEEAIWAAEAGGHDELLAEALAKSVFVVGAQLGELDEAMLIARRADAASQRIGAPRAIEAERIHAVASAQARAGKPVEAIAGLERAAELFEADSDEIDLALTLNNLGLLYGRVGEGERARRVLHRALEIKERIHGSIHPDVAVTIANLGMAETNSVRYEQGLAFHLRALAIQERTLGREHPETARTVNNLGDLLARMGRIDEGLARLHEAIALFERNGGEHQKGVVWALVNITSIHINGDRVGESCPYAFRTFAVAERVYGADHPVMAMAVSNVAACASHHGDKRRALGLLRQVLLITERRLGSMHSDLGVPLNNAGSMQLELGDVVAAISFFERALAIRESTAQPPINLGVSRLNLARALWRAGDRSRANALAARAEVDLRAAGPNGEHRLVELASWRESR